MYELKEIMKKFYSDLLAAYQRNCVCALAGTATWRFFSSGRKVMKSLLVGKGYKPLQSVNYHDSRAHGHERSGVLIGLVGFGIVWIGYVWMGNRIRQLCLGGVTYR
jgi:hypothetical protein